MAKPAAPKNALQAQLLKAGLTNQQKLAKTNRQHQHEHNTGTAQQEQQALAAKIAADQAQKLERDRQLAAQQKAEREEKAIDAAVRQMLDQHRLQDTQGDQAYQFIDQGKVKKIHVKPALFEKIVAGHVCVARQEGRYVLLPRPLAEKIAEKRPQVIVVRNQPAAQTSAVAEDDPYAAFVIPDDLMW